MPIEPVIYREKEVIVIREVLFRAKAINRDKGYHRTSYKNGDWVYGLITRLYDERFENLPAEMTDENGVSRIEIDHSTICQFTGLTDKNGDKIWENDIVRLDEDLYIVTWEEDDAMFALEDVGVVENFSNVDSRWCEVIGNKFDNPELV